MKKLLLILTSVVIVFVVVFSINNINKFVNSKDKKEEMEFKTYKKIKDGMSMNEVERLLGQPKITEKKPIPYKPSIVEKRVYDIYTKKSKGTFDFNTYIFVYYNKKGEVVGTRIDD